MLFCILLGYHRVATYVAPNIKNWCSIFFTYRPHINLVYYDLNIIPKLECYNIHDPVLLTLGWIFDVTRSYPLSFNVASAFSATGCCLLFLIPPLHRSQKRPKNAMETGHRFNLSSFDPKTLLQCEAATRETVL